MSTAALLLLSLGGAHGAAPPPMPVAEPAPVLRFAPPVNAPLVLTIVDDRQVNADGTHAVFTVSHVVQFAADGDGAWLASITQHSAACDGPAAICAAFHAMMAPRGGRTGQFRISASGTVSAVEDGPAVNAPTAGGLAANVNLIIAERDARRPGSTAGAELAEALRFVGQPLAALAATADGALVIADRLAPDAGGSVNQSTIAQVDGATGLVVHSATETRAHAPSGQGVLLGIRRWTLQPVSQAN